MKDKIEQIIEDVMALPDGVLRYIDLEPDDTGYTELPQPRTSTDDLKLLATELLRLRDALAAAEECVGHYANPDQWNQSVVDGKVVMECQDYHGNNNQHGYDHAVKAQAEIKRLKGE